VLIEYSAITSYIKCQKFVEPVVFMVLVSAPNTG